MINLKKAFFLSLLIFCFLFFTFLFSKSVRANYCNTCVKKIDPNDPGPKGHCWDGWIVSYSGAGCTIRLRECTTYKTMDGKYCSECSDRDGFYEKCGTPKEPNLWGIQGFCNTCPMKSNLYPSPTPTLTCPSVKAYCLSSSKVRVYWNGVSGAYSYIVYRDGVYKANVTTNSYTNTNGYTDIRVSCGTPHYYTVNPFPSGGQEKICKQNYKISCPCPPKILSLLVEQKGSVNRIIRSLILALQKFLPPPK